MIGDVSEWPIADLAQDGSDAKEWLVDPDGRHWLCKPAVTPAKGVRQGEDWSEWLGACVAQMLGVPHADVRLASRNGVPAALSRSLSSRMEGDDLQAGAVLLQQVQGFVPRSRERGSAIIRGFLWVSGPLTD